MDKPISRKELDNIEQTLDKLFGKLELDVEFSRHFFDRINDARNGKQITSNEIVNVYNSLYDKYGVHLSKTDDEVEELVKSIGTDINIPLNIYYNPRTKKVILTAKTIMRKKNFQSPNKVLRVEDIPIKSFNEYLKEEITLDEALITFNKKVYPKFGQVVILAGGAGSGKGFVLNRLLGIQGRVINVDDVKQWISKTIILANKIKQETGFDIKNSSLKNPDDVSKLHDIISGLGIADKMEQSLFSSIATSEPNHKPNIIFDVTLKDLNKLDKIARNVIPLGYDIKNIHIVWVVTEFEKAKEQNASRERSVSDSIMVATHKGAAMTMYDLITSNGTDVRKYMDGDIWIAFNNAGVDSTLDKTEKKKNLIFPNRDPESGSYIKKGANYIKVKETGKMPNIDDAVSKKIGSYVPKTGSWK